MTNNIYVNKTITCIIYRIRVRYRLTRVLNHVYVKTKDIFHMQKETYKRRTRNFSNIVQKYVNKTKTKMQ